MLTQEPASILESAPLPIALPDLHARIFPVVQKHIAPAAGKVLDVGAGQGAFSKLLHDASYQVAACDMFPNMFRCPQVECRKSDLHDTLPYADGEFDAVIAIEVVEHLESQLGLFQEIHRVLKPGGKFLFTTPNVASLKSRVGFLLTGYMYSHGPLDPAVKDPVTQHIAPFTPDRYRFLLAQAGLELTHLETDKYQKSSLWLGWLAPMIRLYTRRRFGTTSGTIMQNCRATLFGRSLIGIAVKNGVIVNESQ